MAETLFQPAVGFLFSSATTVLSADRMIFSRFRKPKRNDFDRRSARNLLNWPHSGRNPLTLFFGQRTGSYFKMTLRVAYFLNFELQNLLILRRGCFVINQTALHPHIIMSESQAKHCVKAAAIVGSSRI
jgi:hypothetical protein